MLECVGNLGVVGVDDHLRPAPAQCIQPLRQQRPGICAGQRHGLLHAAVRLPHRGHQRRATLRNV